MPYSHQEYFYNNIEDLVCKRKLVLHLDGKADYKIKWVLVIIQQSD